MRGLCRPLYLSAWLVSPDSRRHESICRLVYSSGGIPPCQGGHPPGDMARGLCMPLHLPACPPLRICGGVNQSAGGIRTRPIGIGVKQDTFREVSWGEVTLLPSAAPATWVPTVQCIYSPPCYSDGVSRSTCFNSVGSAYSHRIRPARAVAIYLNLNFRSRTDLIFAREGKVHPRMSRTRSNRLLWVGAASRSRRNHRRTGKHRSAWSHGCHSHIWDTSESIPELFFQTYARPR